MFSVIKIVDQLFENIEDTQNTHTHTHNRIYEVKMLLINTQIVRTFTCFDKYLSTITDD